MQIVKIIKFYIIFTIHYSVFSLVSISIEKKSWKRARHVCPHFETLWSFAKSTPLLHLFSTFLGVWKFDILQSCQQIIRENLKATFHYIDKLTKLTVSKQFNWIKRGMTVFTIHSEKPGWSTIVVNETLQISNGHFQGVALVPFKRTFFPENRNL